MNDKRLLALDIDETLTRRDRTLSDANLSAVKRAMKNGVVVTIATGRPPNGALSVWELIRPHPLAVCFGGAVVYDFENHTRVFSNNMLPELVTEALEFARENELPAHIYSGENVVAERENPRITNYTTALRLPLVLDADIMKKRWTEIPKVLCFAPIDRTTEYIELARERFGDRLSVLESSPGFIEFNAPDTDKGTGLMHLADSLGIDRKNTIAIGDSPLDVPMIRAAGLGIAVENAHDTAKHAAKIIAPDCDNDAVAWVIDNVILKDR